MRYLIITILVFVGLGTGINLDAARFDWSLGEPTIADDSVDTTRYDWSLGESGIVYEYQVATTGGPVIESSTSSPAVIDEGNEVTFEGTWASTTASTTQAFFLFCKTHVLSATSCDSGEWGSTTLSSAYTASTTYTVQSTDNDSQDVYTLACDEWGICSATSSHTAWFGEVKPIVSSVEDTPDPVNTGSNVTFTINWTDSNQGETVWGYICTTSGFSTSTKTCDIDYWASSTATTTDTSLNLTYTAQVTDEGTNDYYGFICDETDLCAENYASSTWTGQEAVIAEEPEMKIIEIQ